MMIVTRRKRGEFGFAAEIAAGLVSVVPAVLDMFGIKTPAQVAAEKQRQEEAARYQAMLLAQQQQRSDIPWAPIAAIGGGILVTTVLVAVLARK